MIRMHDGNCRPFTIRRGTGRETNPQIWDLKNGQLAIANDPILGWRIEPFAYDKTGIIGVGLFRPSPPGESPFGTNINAFPPATCKTVQYLRDSGVSTKEMRTVEHEAPHPQCTCGLRIVHDVKEIARFFHRHRGNMGYDSLHKGAKDSSAVFAVRGLGLTARSVEFKRFHDPSGTVRTQHVALEAVVLLDSEDSFAAPMFKDLGFDVHVVDRLARAHEQSRCGHEFQVRRVALSDAHKLRLSQDPGADGSWKGNDAVEFGVYGAAGVLIRTQEAEPRYLLQRRAFGSDFGGTWSVPGGARHAKETPGEAAARELGEEMGKLDLDGIKPVRTVLLKTARDWTFHTIIADTPKPFPVDPNSEVSEVAWLTREEIENKAQSDKCHPLFEAALPKLLNEPAKKGRQA